MYGQIFGRFLVKQHYLTSDKCKEAFTLQKEQRPRLGYIAVAEKMLTIEEADKINRRQQQEDRRFGDIAIEHKYLTAAQVESLVKAQGSPYHSFCQTLICNDFLTQDQLEKAERGFQEENGWSEAEYEEIKSGEIDRILPLYLKTSNSFSEVLTGIAVRSMIRLIDPDAVPCLAYAVNQFSFAALGVQNLVGDHNIFLGIASDKECDLLAVAEIYAKETFGDMGEDAYDSVCELINCINGMYASAMSVQNMTLDMVPPGYYSGGIMSCSDKIMILPVLFGNHQVQIVIAVDAEVTIEAE